MDENSLMCVINDHYTYLKEMINDINKDIKYYEDLVLLNRTHGRSDENVKKLLIELNIKQKTIKEIMDNFDENMENEDIDIEEIKQKVYE